MRISLASLAWLAPVLFGLVVSCEGAPEGPQPEVSRVTLAIRAPNAAPARPLPLPRVPDVPKEPTPKTAPGPDPKVDPVKISEKLTK